MLAGEPGRGGALVALGTMLLDRGDAAGGLTHLERALRVNPEDLAALSLAGIAAEEGGRLAQIGRAHV